MRAGLTIWCLLAGYLGTIGQLAFCNRIVIKQFGLALPHLHDLRQLRIKRHRFTRMVCFNVIHDLTNHAATNSQLEVFPLEILD